MVLNLIRKAGFWTLDWAKGGIIKKDVADICEKMSRQDRTHRDSEQLKELLQYARKTVPHYKKMTSDNLYDFPVISKSDIKAEPEAFLAENFPAKDMLISSTSGTNGIPLRIVQDKRKKKRTHADLIYCHKKAGWDLGDKFFFIRGWSAAYKRSGLKNFMQNVIQIDSRNLSIDEKEKFRSQVKKHKGIVVFGYASALTELVDYLLDCGDQKNDFNVKLVVSDSDMLTAQTKQKLNELFQCDVVNRCDDEEMGLLAYTEKNGDVFTVNTASYVMELLKMDSDLPAEKGELGRIVVTDLYNRAMPFIRYDTGDLARSSDDNRSDLSYIYSLEGRKVGLIYSTDGLPVSTVTIGVCIERFTNVRQFQLRDYGNKKYTLRLVCDKDEKQEKQIAAALKDCLREDAEITVEYCEKIEKNKNGKYSMTLNCRE